MAYSVVGLLAIFVHIIVNFDVLFRKGGRSFPGGKQYLLFLLCVVIFHVADGLWGILYDNHLANALFVDTSFYFVGMGLSILFWGMFIIKYLGNENKLIKSIAYLGYIVFGIQMVAIVVNIFVPILFNVTKECEYSAGPVRYATLALQILMFLLIAILMLLTIIQNKGKSKRKNLAILSFSLSMIIAVALQVFFPLLPMYSLGYLFGVSALHTFVLEQQKAERQKELEEARIQVEIDALTGMKSKHAYVDKEEQIDNLIANNEMHPFAIVVFDLNDLKIINDTYGHEAGDIYIVAATKLIGQTFPHSEIFRIGGDEFAAILENGDYADREALLKQFDDMIIQNLKKRKGVVVASGLSTYLPDQDNTFIQVFNRADRAMYQRKHELKEGINGK